MPLVACLTLFDGSVALMHSSMPVRSVTAEGSRRVPSAQWLEKNGDIHRSGASHSIAPRMLAKGPTWEWSAPASLSPVSRVVRASPLIDEEQNVIVSTIQGNLFKFSPGGEALWNFSAGGCLPAVPAIMDGVIYTAREDGVILAVDSQTGQLLWDLKVADETPLDTHSLLAVDGLVIADTGVAHANGASYSFSAISVKEKKEVWRFSGVPLYNFLPAAYNGSLLFESCYGVMYRLSLEDGSVVWEMEPPLQEIAHHAGTGGVALDEDGNIYATHNYFINGTKTGSVTARRFSDGELLWHREFEHEANAGPAVGRLDGTADSPLAVFVPIQNNLPLMINFSDYSLEDGSAYALDAATGETLWRYDFQPWYGAARGDAPWHVCWPDSFANPAVDGRGTVYLGRGDGFVYAMHDDNHDRIIDDSEVSKFDATQAYQGSPAISDNMVALTDCAGLRVFMEAS